MSSRKSKTDDERALTITPSGAVKTKKAAAKQSAAKNQVQAGAPAKPKKKEHDTSSKTPQVMKLVEPHDDYINPIIVAGKGSIPKPVRGMEPLSRIMRRDAAKALDESEPQVVEEMITLNLTEEVGKENAREILRRFNGCDCEKCIAELTRLTTEKIPARYAKVTKSAAEKNTEELREMKEPLKKSVVAQMVREMILNKKRNFH